MSREVRRVPAGWVHPKDDLRRDYKPLYAGERYEQDVSSFMGKLAAEGLQAAIDWCVVPDRNDYMPNWPASERTHYMMYEDTSEGTPISPAFATPEELARWLADTGASSFGSMTADYEAWLWIARGGWAPSMVYTPESGLQDGVSAAAEPEAKRRER